MEDRHREIPSAELRQDTQTSLSLRVCHCTQKRVEKEQNGKEVI